MPNNDCKEPFELRHSRSIVKNSTTWSIEASIEFKITLQTFHNRCLWSNSTKFIWSFPKNHESVSRPESTNREPVFLSLRHKMPENRKIFFIWLFVSWITGDVIDSAGLEQEWPNFYFAVNTFKAWHQQPVVVTRTYLVQCLALPALTVCKGLNPVPLAKNANTLTIAIAPQAEQCYVV